MLQLVVAQRRRDSSQGGRARGPLATSPHYVLVAVQFYVIKDSYVQLSEVAELLFRRRYSSWRGSEAGAHTLVEEEREAARARAKAASTRW